MKRIKKKKKKKTDSLVAVSFLGQAEFCSDGMKSKSPNSVVVALYLLSAMVIVSVRPVETVRTITFARGFEIPHCIPSIVHFKD